MFPEGQKVSTFLNEISSLFARMKALDNTLAEDLLTNKILSGLPENYNGFVTAWRLTDKTALSELMASLLREENTEERQAEEQVAFAAGPSSSMRVYSVVLRVR